MKSLPSNLRKQLENVCIAARDKAEEAALSALRKRGVDAAEPFPHFSDDDRKLRNRLRAHGRQIGDQLASDKTQSIELLAQELAYKYWHRMIFARFLAENHLLMHPDGVAVSLEECEELAEDEGCANGWELAARYASRMLPQIFPIDDVVLECEFAPEHRLALEKLLAELPTETLQASDSLGWVYQFWQSRRKEEVNKSGVKIGARELPSVTQLFTEDYMVDFLLDNTLGAWWAGKVLSHDDLAHATSEDELREKAALPGVDWSYLRFVRESDAYSKEEEAWRPAAGTFDGWPNTASELKCLDPCMGSGHFIVAMFDRLVSIRMAEEGLSESDAIAAVIRDNLFGLEIDPRCTQIAAFNLAFAAWKRVGHCQLPLMRLACSGLAPNTSKNEWVALAGKNEKLRIGMERMFDLFVQAPIIGSLINPRAQEGELFVAEFHDLQPLLKSAIGKKGSDSQVHELAVTASGLAKAGEILSDQFTLVATNVPYLGRGKQNNSLMEYCENLHPEGKADLATCFLERCLAFCSQGSTTALVTPQNWLFLGGYKRLRQRLLTSCCWNWVARLGEHAFDSPQAGGAFVALVCLSSPTLSKDFIFSGIDASYQRTPHEKALALVSQLPTLSVQLAQIKNPDARIILGEPLAEAPALGEYCECYQGLVTGDQSRFCRRFWEIADHGSAWVPLRASYENGAPYSGVDQVLLWEGGIGQLDKYAALTRDQLHDMHESGNRAWGRNGVAVNRMRNLRTTLYFGEHFENCLAVIVPKNPKILPAVWAFCSDASFKANVRALDQKVSLTNATLVKIPFELAHWQKIADEKFPNGLPKPVSADPTQWVFKGHPASADQSLHVVVARLLGYFWPRQTGLSFSECPALEADGLESLADEDGVVCISAIRGEKPGTERIIELLREAYSEVWNDGSIDKLLVTAGCKPGTTIEDWLRNQFFEQHCKLFHQRPFIWHIWDGRKDGFSCLVNYHKLDHKTLESVTYSYLGDWINLQRGEANAGKPGADLRLKAAQDLQEKLKLILAGEPPYDIFVRWKPLSQQAIGWNPDLNDGVRMNIRPFVEAGVLRKNPNIKWTKDRGKEPERPADEYPWFWRDGVFTGERVNDVHLTTAEKLAVRPDQAVASAGRRR